MDAKVIFRQLTDWSFRYFRLADKSTVMLGGRLCREENVTNFSHPGEERTDNCPRIRGYADLHNIPVLLLLVPGVGAIRVRIQPGSAQISTPRNNGSVAIVGGSARRSLRGRVPRYLQV